MALANMPTPTFNAIERHPMVRTGLIRALLAESYPLNVAEQWADGWSQEPDLRAFVSQVNAFDDLGIDINEAIAWHRHGFYAADAARLRRRCRTPQQARDLLDAIESDDELDAWLATGIPVVRIIDLATRGLAPSASPVRC